MKTLVVLVLILVALGLIFAGVASAGGWERVKWSVELLAPISIGIGVAVLTTVSVWFIEGKIRDWLSIGPSVKLIDNDQRCDELKRAVLQNKNSILYTTRFSTRPIGDKEKSEAYVFALKSRIASRIANTYRIISLDYDEDAVNKKIDHAKDLLQLFFANDRFELRIRPKNFSKESIFDLLVSDGKFVCIGIEGAARDDNYWIRIDDENISQRLREFYTSFYIEQSIEIKSCNDILNEQQCSERIAKLEQLKREHLESIGSS